MSTVTIRIRSTYARVTEPEVAELTAPDIATAETVAQEWMRRKLRVAGSGKSWQADTRRVTGFAAVTVRADRGSLTATIRPTTV